LEKGAHALYRLSGGMQGFRMSHYKWREDVVVTPEMQQ
jgi:hypothetical protein